MRSILLMMGAVTLGIGGSSHELRQKLRQSWLAAAAVAPLIGPLGIALFWNTAMPLQAMVWWSIGHLVIGLASIGALMADRSDRFTLANNLDWFYRFGMVSLFGALPWMGQGLAGREPTIYMLALCMVVSSAGGSLVVTQFSGRSTILLALVAASNLSYTIAYVVNRSLVMAAIALTWTLICVAIGRVAADVHVELVRLRTAA